MNLSDKTVAELKQLAKDSNVNFQQGIKKQELIDILEANMETQEDKELNFLEEDLFETTATI